MPEGSLGCLFTEGWCCDPTWIVVCPGASQLTDGWGQIFPKWPPPEKGTVAEYSRELCLQCPSLTTSRCHPLFPESPPRTAVGSVPYSYGAFALPLDPVHVKSMCTFQEWGLCFPLSCGALAHKPHWPSMPDAPGALSPSARPQAWGFDVGLRTLTPIGEAL